MNRRSWGIAAGVALVALLVAVAVVAALGLPGAPDARSSGDVGSSMLAPAPIEPPPDALDPVEAERAAVDALVTAGGWTRLRCPASPGADAALARSGRCALDGTALSCAVRDPAGVVAVRPPPVADQPRPAPSDPPSTVLRWSTGPDGTTRCATEASVARALPVTILDRAGRPAAGASVSAVGFAGAAPPAGPDGKTVFSTWTAGPVELFAYRDWDRSARVTVGGDDAELPPLSLRTDGQDRATATAEVTAEAAARDAAERAAIDRALAAPGLADDVTAVLEAWRGQLDRAAALRARVRDPDADPDAGGGG